MIQKIRNFSAWHKQKLIKKITIFFIVIICITVLGTGVWFLRNSDFMKVNEIRVSGTRMVSPEDIIKLIKSEDSRHDGLLRFILPKNHRFAYKNNEELFKLIQRRFPRVEKTTITHDYKNRTISIAVIEQREAITWCITPDDARHCFWLSDSGIVLGKAPDSHGTIIPVITDTTNRNIFLGRKLIDETRLKNIIEATEMFLEFNWAVEEIMIDNILLRNAIITINSGQKIFISLLRSPEIEGRPVLSEILLSGKWPRVEYVDLRVEGKGFYKLR